MTPSAPKQLTWILGLLLGILGIVGHYVSISFISEYNYLLLLFGFILLALGTSVKGI